MESEAKIKMFYDSFIQLFIDFKDTFRNEYLNEEVHFLPRHRENTHSRKYSKHTKIERSNEREDFCRVFFFIMNSIYRIV